MSLSISLESSAYDELHDLAFVWLEQFNLTKGIRRSIEQVAFRATDGGAAVGALTATVVYGWMYITALAVDPTCHRRGTGTALIRAAEQYAAEHDLIGMYVSTMSFQRPAFYRKMGFQEIGRVPDCPPGHDRLFLAKRLKTFSPIKGDAGTVTGSAP